MAVTASRFHFEELDAATIQPDWDRLAWASGNVFATPEWAAAWWRHLGRGEPLLLGCRSHDGALVGLLALERSGSRGVRTLRAVGSGPADEVAPVCAPADASDVAAALRRHLATRRDWDVLRLGPLPAGGDWAALLGGRILALDSSPVLEISGSTWEAFLASRSRNFREQVRRRERRLARDHELRFRLAERPAEVDAALVKLMTLHEARWAGASSAFAGPRRAFHAEFARTAHARGWARLWVLELDGEPAAAWYGLRFAGRDAFYQSGRDPNREQHAVGFVLLVHTIREAFTDGMRAYRFGVGGESYKSRFASADPGVVTVAVTRGTRGAAGLLISRGIPSARSRAAGLARRASVMRVPSRRVE